MMRGRSVEDGGDEVFRLTGGNVISEYYNAFSGGYQVFQAAGIRQSSSRLEKWVRSGDALGPGEGGQVIFAGSW